MEGGKVAPGELADFCNIRRRQDKCLCPVIQIGDRNFDAPLAEGVGAAIGYWLIVRNTQGKCFSVGKGKYVSPPVFSGRKTRDAYASTQRYTKSKVLM